MAAPSLRVAGTRVDGTTASLSPSHPSGILADDIVLLHAFFHEGTTTTTGTWNTPTGFALVRKQNLTVGGAKKGELAVFWKRAVGGESGTVSVSRSGGTGNATVSTSNMSVWQDCVTTGDPWEGLTGVTDEATPYPMGVTTTGVDRLVLAWVFANDNVAATGTDANFTNVIAPYTDPTGPDYAGHLASRAAPTANTYSGSWTQSAGIEGALVGLALIGRGATQYNSTPSGSLSFAGALSRQASRALTGSLSFTGALARRTGKALAGTLGFSVDFNRRTGRGLSGVVSFSTSFTHEYQEGEAGTPALICIHFHTE